MNEPLNFLIVSEGGDGLGLALRLQAEGHSVAMWIRDSESERRGEGLVEKSSTPEPNPLILADCTGAGSLLDVYRDSGILTFGGSGIADKLESDRRFSSKVFKECGIPEPHSQEFHSWEAAEAFVASQSNEVRLVFKPEGRFSGNVPSYVSSDNADLIGMLHHYKGLLGEEEPQFVLQEFVEGVCVSSEAWFAKDHFVEGSFNHTFERKQLMPGDLGPSGGCTGNVVWRCDDYDECSLCNNVHKLEPFLKESSYIGPIDINSVVTKEGEIYALEFTPRFGYDAFPTLLYGLFDGDFGQFVYDCARGSGDAMPLRDGFAAGIRISVPPWPSEEFHAKSGIPIRGLRKADFAWFYPYEVSLVEEKLVTSGGVGIIGLAVGMESSIEGAFESAYKLADRLRLPDKQYRRDLVEVFEKDFRQLRRSVSVQSVNA